jgi:hypothetical protein
MERVPAPLQRESASSRGSEGQARMGSGPFFLRTNPHPQPRNTHLGSTIVPRCGQRRPRWPRYWRTEGPSRGLCRWRHPSPRPPGSLWVSVSRRSFLEEPANTTTMYPRPVLASGSPFPAEDQFKDTLMLLRVTRMTRRGGRPAGARGVLAMVPPSRTGAPDCFRRPKGRGCVRNYPSPVTGPFGR